MMRSTNKSGAIVIGGGIAGLLAARVLSDHFDQVTLVERDTLPEQREPRSGVPQALHIHTLLARGRQIVEELYPGIDAELEAQGVGLYTWGLDALILTTGGYLRRVDTGIHARAHSRTMLEWLIRCRTRKIPNIDFLTGCQVTDLIVEDNTVTGIQLTQRGSQTPCELYGDLVVDTSGRNSRTGQWLAEKGYPHPEETHINSFLGYATRWYRIPEGVEIEPPGVLIQVGAQPRLYRGAAAARIEDGQVIITLAGQNKDYPPTNEAGFLEFARSLPDPKLYEWIQALEPVTPIQGYRAANRLRHYERLKRYPEHFIVMGDAACILNPIYGQGMTSAALQAQLLDRQLARQDVRDLGGFARRFQKGVQRVTRIPWLLATGEDRRYPLVEGPPPNFFDRIVHRYIDLLFLAAAQDSAIANALLRTMQLLDHPVMLFRPRVMAGAVLVYVKRVWRRL